MKQDSDKVQTYSVSRTTSVETEKNIRYKHKCKKSGVVEAVKAVCGQ